MDKKVIFLGMLFGSVIGGYIPTVFGADVFSIYSIIGSTLGAFLGIWLSFRLLN
jgi:uncharacterized membrane protein YeaQ/YmgE (transglycosylase-associated protein family)